MGTSAAAPTTEAVDERPPVINDFSIVAATVNGTGSQTANLALLRALFKMGIPVNGKNIFPSNIQGLPTWYHIRVSHEGYISRKEISEILDITETASRTQLLRGKERLKKLLIHKRNGTRP